MPEGTRVHDCVDEVKKRGGKVNPYAVCQASTGQSFHTGKPLNKQLKALRMKYRTKGLKISSKPAETMSNTEILKEWQKLHDIDSELTDQMIESGRGHETANEWLKGTDPLSRQLQDIHARRRQLSIEAKLRGFEYVRQITPGGYRRIKALQTKYQTKSIPENEWY